jgi:hypothetical protein
MTLTVHIASALTVHIASLCWPTEILFRKGSKDGPSECASQISVDVNTVIVPWMMPWSCGGGGSGGGG